MKKYLVLMCMFGAIEIALANYLTFWRHDFWQSVQQRQTSLFITQLCIFSIVALCLCFVNSYAQYLATLAAIKWREKLNKKASVCLNDCTVDNVTQRIQEDCYSYPTLVINLGFGFIKSIVYLIVFSVTLCLEFSYIYLCILLLYSIISTLLSKRIARPLISLQYESQKVEATYRNSLSKYNFKECIRVSLNVARQIKLLQYFQTFYGQIGTMIPILLLSPGYFASLMTFGSLMQGQSIMSTILDNLSFGINSFSDINKFLSCKKRLKEINVL